MEIIHNPSLEEPFIVAYKAQGLPTAPIKEGDNCAFTQIAEIFPECKSVQGKKAIEGGLLHRLDTDTQGLILIATNQDFYDYMLEGQEEGRFLKKYVATCNRDLLITEKLKGFPPLPKDIQMNLNKSNRFVLTSSFRAFGKGRKEVRPVTEECGHYQSKKASKNTYETIIELNKNKDTWFTVRKLMLEDPCLNSLLGVEFDCIVYGEGNKVTQKINSLEDYLSIDQPFCGKVCYWGDLDLKGIDMYLSFKGISPRQNICPFIAAYELMIDRFDALLKNAENKEIFIGHDNQTAPENIEEFYLAFDEMYADRLAELFSKGYYIPQEILNYEVLKELAGQ